MSFGGKMGSDLRKKTKKAGLLYKHSRALDDTEQLLAARIKAAVEGLNLGKTAYAKMGLPRTAGPARISERFRELASILHPDRGGDPGSFALLVDAYSSLKSNSTRDDYDAYLDVNCSTCRACKGTGVVIRTKGFSGVEEMTCDICGGSGSTD